MQTIRHITLIGWLTVVAQSTHAMTSRIPVSLEPGGFAFGGARELRVGSPSGLGNQGTLPEMEGLELARTGRSSQDPSASGEVRESQSLVQPALATRARITTIPALAMDAGGHAGSSIPVALRGTGSGSTPVPAVDHESKRPATPAALGAAPTAYEPQTGLAPNRVEPGAFVPTLRPRSFLPRILIVGIVALAGIVATSSSFRRRIRLARLPHLLRASLAGYALRADLATMADAVRRAEAGEFFDTARGALQDRLGDRWGLAPEMITLADIEARTNDDADNLRRIFEMADRLSHRAGCLSSAELAYWQIIVRNELERWR